jgi:PIN domain nuclease of toxin-antitoxin system
MGWGRQNNDGRIFRNRMREYLLDSHTVIWSLTAPDKISETAKEIIENPLNKIVVNAVSFWEISLKHGLGKLLIDPFDPTDFPEGCTSLGFYLENLEVEIASTFGQLRFNENHRDPFDRMLIWNAIKTKRPIISKDEKFDQYKSEGLKVVW